MNLRKQLAGHWTCDSRDTSNGTLRDRSGYGNHGTLKNGVTTDKVGNVPTGEACSFDGTDDYIHCGTDVLNSDADFTLTAWIRTSMTGTGLIADERDSGHAGAFHEVDSGSYHAYVSDGSSNVELRTGTINDGVWHHVAATYDESTTELTAYIDGVLQTSNTNTSVGGSNPSDAFIIGNQSGGSTGFDGTNPFNGQISGVRVYSRVLTDAEINALANQRTPRHKGTPTEAALAGVQGHWPLADQTGPAEDLTTNQYDGTLSGGVTTRVDAPTGYGMDFDGTDDVVDTGITVADVDTETLTFAAWAKFTTTVDSDWEVVVGTRNSADFQLGDNGGDGTAAVLYQTQSTGHERVTSSIDVNDGEWHHLAGTFDSTGAKLYVDGELVGQNNQSGTIKVNDNIGIGGEPSSNRRFLDGSVADVRIYSRSLSPHEIRTIMDAGLPCTEAGLVGHWTMDDADTSSGTLSDRSPKGNDGTLYGGVSTGQSGQIAESYYFDGTDDYVDMGQPAALEESALGSTLTLAAWVKPDDVSTTHRQNIMGKGSDTYNDTYRLWITSSSFDFYLDGGPDLSASAESGTWQHVVATWDGNSGDARLYVNGEVVASTNSTGSLTSGSAPFALGSRGGDSDFYAGIIDDPRVYTRALSPKEVRSLYRTRAAYYEGGPGNTSPRKLTGGARL